MPFWGTEADECDFAFDAVGAIIYVIIEKMKKDIEIVLEKAYPEQSMIACLICLRLLGERFPKNLKVSFRKKQFIEVTTAFEEWYTKVADKLPLNIRVEILAKAKEEFALFEERLLK